MTRVSIPRSTGNEISKPVKQIVKCPLLVVQIPRNFDVRSSDDISYQQSSFLRHFQY
jgi:hypothetical protein